MSDFTNPRGIATPACGLVRNDSNLVYQGSPSDRKSMTIRVTPEGKVEVRYPKWMSRGEVDKFVESKRAWIETHLKKVAVQFGQEKLTMEEVEALADRALEIVPERVGYFAQMLGVSYGNITIRSQHSRWGSCSGKGNLNFNCLLMLTPPEVLDYVVVHELCHRKEMNHSPQFWTEVEKICPDYKIHRKWLKDNGGSLIARLP